MRPHGLDRWLVREMGGPYGAAMPDPMALDALRLERLNATLTWTRALSPSWRMHLAGTPEQLQSWDELARLPLFSPADLQRHGAALCCLPQGAFERVVTLQSSATTGPAKRLYFTGEDLDATVEFFAAGMGHIVPSGGTVLLLMPGDRPGTVGDLLAQGLARLGASCISLGFLKDVEALHRAATQHAARCVVGLPWQLLAAARAGGRIPGLASVLLSADRAPQWLVDELQERLDCEVFLHWGMTESCLGGAVDCPTHDGLHPRWLDLHLEIIDPQTGAPRPMGQHGELVLTTLARRGMPLIRYRTGDRARLLPGPCACGSLLPRLENPSGRLRAPVALATGDMVEETALDDAVLQTPGLHACLLELRRTGEGHAETLRVLASGESGQTTARKADLAGAVTERVRAVPGCGRLEVEVLELPLSALLAQAMPKRILRIITTHEEPLHASA